MTAPTTSIHDLCREWRLITAKLEYELAALAETDDDGTTRLIGEAGHRIAEIEQALTESDIDSLADAQAILSIAIKNLAEKGVVEAGDVDMVRAVRAALSHLRHKTGDATAAA